MNTKQRFHRLICPPLLTPRGFVARAVYLALVFVVCQLAGLREHTAFLSGTPGAAGMDLTISTVLGVFYLAAYYGLVLFVPLLLIGSAILFGLEKVISGLKAAPPCARASSHGQEN